MHIRESQRDSDVLSPSGKSRPRCSGEGAKPGEVDMGAHVLGPSRGVSPDPSTNFTRLQHDNAINRVQSDVPAWPLHVEHEVRSPQAYERVSVCVSPCAGRINIYEAIYRIHANWWMLNSPHSHVLKRHVLTHACAYGRHSTHIELCGVMHACMSLHVFVCLHARREGSTMLV